MHSKEPYAHPKEPYVHPQEPYVHSKTTYAHKALIQRGEHFNVESTTTWRALPKLISPAYKT